MNTSNEQATLLALLADVCFGISTTDLSRFEKINWPSFLQMAQNQDVLSLIIHLLPSEQQSENPIQKPLELLYKTQNDQCLCPEDYFVQLLSTISHKFVASGLGLRQLTELMSFSQAYMPQMDFLKINRSLCQLELLPFYSALAVIAKRYFHQTWPNQTSNESDERASLLLQEILKYRDPHSSTDSLQTEDSHLWYQNLHTLLTSKKTSKKRQHVATKLGLR